MEGVLFPMDMKLMVIVAVGVISSQTATPVVVGGQGHGSHGSSGLVEVVRQATSDFQ